MHRVLGKGKNVKNRIEKVQCFNIVMASVWKLFAFKLKIATAVINMFMKLQTVHSDYTHMRHSVWKVYFGRSLVFASRYNYNICTLKRGALKGSWNTKTTPNSKKKLPIDFTYGWAEGNYDLMQSMLFWFCIKV